MRRTTVGSLLVLLFLSAGCDSGSLVGPSFVELDGLELTLELEQNVVPIGSSFEIEIRAHNTSSETKEFSTGNSCFTLPSVTRFGIRRPEFINVGCLTVGRHWEIPPGETLTHAYTVPVGNGEGLPEPGEYVLEVEFPTDPDLPSLGAPFEVTL